MTGVDFAALADRHGLTLEQVLEIASLGPALSDVAGGTVRSRIVLDAVNLDRSRAERARPETEDEYRFAEEYAERWAD